MMSPFSLFSRDRVKGAAMIDEGLLIDFPLSAPEDTYVTYTYTGHQWFEVVILCWREHIAKHVIDANRADIALPPKIDCGRKHASSPLVTRPFCAWTIDS